MPAEDQDEYPEGVTLFDPEDHAAHRDLIYRGVAEELSAQFPVSMNGVRLELADVGYDDDGDQDMGPAKQKQALLGDRYLARRLRGTVRLLDEATGKPLDERRLTLMRVPHLTDRGTFIHGGSDYTSVAQARLLPGVYARRQRNGELETQFNSARGTGARFRVAMEPATGQYRLRVQDSNMHLYSLLRDMGVEDDELRRSWGPDILDINRARYDPRVLDKAYQRMVPRREWVPDATREAKAAAVRAALDRAQLDERIARRNLPGMFDRAQATRWAKAAAAQDAVDFAPDLSPDDLQEDYNRLYGKTGPQLASLKEWPDRYFTPYADQMGWLSWYFKYHAGERGPDDARQIGRWKRFRAREAAAFLRKPTPRRAFALRHWAIDPIRLLPRDSRPAFRKSMEDHRRSEDDRWLAKKAALTIDDLRALATFLNTKFSAGLDMSAGELELERQIMEFVSGAGGVDPAMLAAGIEGLRAVREALP